MPTDSSTPAPNPFDDEPDRATAATATHSKPRLSILHLMVWTATSAAMMALLRLPQEAANQLSNFETAFRIAFAMYGGVVTGGVVIWIARYFRGVPFPTEPGEWLLLVQGETVLLAVIVSLLVAAGEPIDRALLPLVIVLSSLFFLTLLVIGILPAIRYREGGAWRWFFGAFAALYAIPLVAVLIAMLGGFVVFGLISILMMLIVLVAAIFFLVAVGTDLKRRIQRGWVHWAGAWSLTFFAISYIAMTVITLTIRVR